MSVKFSGWISLEDLWFVSTTNVRDSSRIDDKVFDSDIVEIDFEWTFLRSGLINDDEVESKGDFLMRIECGEYSGDGLSPVGKPN